jgi:hypothetical protein
MKGIQFFRKHGIEPFDVYVNYHYAYALYVLYLIAAMQLAEDVEDELCVDELEAVILLENLSEAEEVLKYYREQLNMGYAGFDVAEKITMKGCRLEQGKIVGSAEDAAQIAGMWIRDYHGNRVNLFIYEVGIYILLFLQKEIDFSFLARKKV